MGFAVSAPSDGFGAILIGFASLPLLCKVMREWSDIARSFDIATGYFEIGSLLQLDGH